MNEQFSSSLVQETVAKEVETKEEIEMRIRKEIIAKGKEFEGVEFKFREPKRKIAKDALPATLNWNLFNKNLSVQEKLNLQSLLEKMEAFLDSPIITDNFDDHGARRVWEGKYLEQLSPEAQAYYSHNRLGLNFATGVIKFRNYFDPINLLPGEEMKMNEEAYKLLLGMCSIIPEPLKNGDDYGELSLEDKIICIEN